MPHDRRQSRALALSAALGASGILFLSTVASAYGGALLAPQLNPPLPSLVSTPALLLPGITTV